MNALTAVLVAVALVLGVAACGGGGGRQLTEEEVCGPGGCTACIGLHCLSTDGGALSTDGGAP